MGNNVIDVGGQYLSVVCCINLKAVYIRCKNYRMGKTVGDVVDNCVNDGFSVGFFFLYFSGNAVLRTAVFAAFYFFN